MSKPVSEKLKHFETALETIDNLNQRITDCESRISSIESRQSLAEAKIKQLIDEITPILSSHANALKELMNKLNRNNTSGQ